MEKILITGASGFVGHHLACAAKEAGLEVHAAVRASSDISHLERMVSKFVYPDFGSSEKLSSLLQGEGYHYIIHAAAMTRAKNRAVLELVNVSYTENLALAARMSASSLKRFVFVSSLAAVGPLAYDAAKPIDERTPLHPVTAYGKSKRMAEERLTAIADLPLTIIRPTAVYGPRERDLLVLFKTLNKGWDMYIGRRPQKLSFIYVKDLADLIIKAVLKPTGERKLYHATDGNTYGRYELGNIFNEFRGKKAKRIHVPVKLVSIVAGTLELMYSFSDKIPVLYPERLNELTAPNWECDISAARHDLGFAPKYDLKSGLAETMHWYRSNGWIN